MSGVSSVSRRAFVPALTVALALAAAAGPASATLQGRFDAANSRANVLSSGIAADNAKAARFDGKISDLQARLSALQSSLRIERAQLRALTGRLAHARQQLSALQISLAYDRRALADQLRAQYETPRPDLVNVVIDARGFADLLERVNQLRAIGVRNAETFIQVRDRDRATAVQAARLRRLEEHQHQLTDAVQVQRDEVAAAHLAVVERKLQYVRARNRKSAELKSLNAQRRSLAARLFRLSGASAGAYPSSAGSIDFGGAGLYTGSSGSFSPHGGAYGFFPAAGTNYSVGREPELAARLDNLGRALHLHLIGLSGYRSPQHSVEVGGFADDPHTRGEASDTPGVEGVPEGTLNQFGLTRPFGGAAEADHIQLRG